MYTFEGLLLLLLAVSTERAGAFTTITSSTPNVPRSVLLERVTASPLGYYYTVRSPTKRNGLNTNPHDKNIARGLIGRGNYLRASSSDEDPTTSVTTTTVTTTTVTKTITTTSSGSSSSPTPTVTTNTSDDDVSFSSSSPPPTTTTDDFDTILRTRRTINDFSPTLPKNWDRTLRNAVSSAIYAPNHKRSEPWRFHLLGPETIQKVCELNASIVSEKKGAEAGKKKLERWLKMPGWLVVTRVGSSSGGGSVSDDPTSLAREDYAACCCAVQNLCLSLHNAGMGTKWTTGPVNFDPRFGEIVGFGGEEEGEEESVVGTIWFGTPVKVPEAPKKKRGLEDVFVEHD